jgi:hypothetical protein
MSEAFKFYAFMFWTTQENYNKMLDTFTKFSAQHSPQKPNDLSEFLDDKYKNKSTGEVKEWFFTCRTSFEMALRLKVALMMTCPDVPIVISDAPFIEEAIEKAKKAKIAQMGENPKPEKKKKDHDYD